MIRRRLLFPKFNVHPRQILCTYAPTSQKTLHIYDLFMIRRETPEFICFVAFFESIAERTSNDENISRCEINSRQFLSISKRRTMKRFQNSRVLFELSSNSFSRKRAQDRIKWSRESCFSSLMSFRRRKRHVHNERVYLSLSNEKVDQLSN